MCSAAELVFVRHAAVDCARDGVTILCGRYDLPLSAAGRRQVELLRTRLAAESSFAALYTSPLKRTRETAAAAPPDLRAKLRVARSLAEIDCGALDGAPIETVRQHYPELWAANEAQSDACFAWPGGESYQRFRNRVLRVVKCIARAHSGSRVLIVTHAGVINQVMGHLACQSPAYWKSPRPHNASLTRILWSADGGEIAAFDDCSHLSLAA